MRRPAVIATLLLPLPFAALPLLSVAFASWTSDEPAPTVAAVRYEAPAPSDLASREAPPGNPLAYSAPDSPHHGECGASAAAIGG